MVGTSGLRRTPLLKLIKMDNRAIIASEEIQSSGRGSYGGPGEILDQKRASLLRNIEETMGHQLSSSQRAGTQRRTWWVDAQERANRCGSEREPKGTV